MWIVFGILFAAIFLFITEWVRVDVVALGVMVSLMATQLLTPAEALSGFSNTAVLTIAALFVVGGAVMQTGLAGAIGRRILSIAGTNPARLTVVIMISVALLSGFMSDTGTVAVLLPAIISLARGAKIPPSKLLIPLAFGSLLGGATTLIGTTPNIIVSELLESSGYEPFGFFSFTPLGLILIVAGITFMVFFGRKLLPDRQHKMAPTTKFPTPEELVDMYRLPDNLFRLRVRRGSPAIGAQLGETGMRRNFGVTIIEILRQPPRRPVMKLGESQLVLQTEKPEILAPEVTQTIQRDDILIVQGDLDDITHASAHFNLGVQAIREEDEESLINDEVGIAEILIPPRSRLLGKTITGTRFGSQHKLTVLGIHGPASKEKLEIGSALLRFGDILLVQGAWRDILALRNQKRDFVVMGQPEAMIGAPAKKLAPVALVLLAIMLILIVGEFLPIVVTAMLTGLLMILFGCLSADEAYQSIDWKSIVLIAGMLPMSIALEKVGLVSMAATELTQNLGSFGPSVVLAILFIVTALFTQVLSNTATAVLIAPIALAAAVNLGVAPQAFLMSVAVAASMAFASPVASPVNTLVMGAGDYQFKDYLKVGLPMILLTLLLSVFLLPVFFPF
jgi:di/tricarboxylate transporter